MTQTSSRSAVPAAHHPAPHDYWGLSSWRSGSHPPGRARQGPAG
jgi:hypothetical protein